MIYRTDDGRYIVSSGRGRVWLPGIYEDQRAAQYAFSFYDHTLEKFSNKIGHDRTITYSMLKELRKTL